VTGNRRNTKEIGAGGKRLKEKKLGTQFARVRPRNERRKMGETISGVGVKTCSWGIKRGAGRMDRGGGLIRPRGWVGGSNGRVRVTAESVMKDSGPSLKHGTVKSTSKQNRYRNLPEPRNNLVLLEILREKTGRHGERPSKSSGTYNWEKKSSLLNARNLHAERFEEQRKPPRRNGLSPG